MADNKNQKRYRGYRLDGEAFASEPGRQPWFWKTLGISLLLTVLILAIAVLVFLHRTNKNTSYIDNMNASNTMEKLLDGHKNVTITCSYSHLAEGDDYTTLRQVRKDKKGNYYSYFKKEGSDDDYKEVISNKKLYRYNGTYTTFYGLIGDDYEKECVAAIEGSAYSGNTKDKVRNEKESGNVITVQTTYEVQSGDDYETTYGFSVGDTIEKTITMDKDTGIVTAEEEKNGEEVFFIYKVEFDTDNRKPQFFKTLQKETQMRTCTVYSNYDGESNKEYTYKVPFDVYFTVLDHDGMAIYRDKLGTEKFTSYQMEVQNPETDLTLYVKAEKDSSGS